ncbi:hypothetical protein JB92DRAFT_1885773 [Gautieria morchelliformis]|nr:hypothetical protein JB92DRAFT_1885773 [Gautieria morchelliformis]
MYRVAHILANCSFCEREKIAPLVGGRLVSRSPMHNHPTLLRRVQRMLRPVFIKRVWLNLAENCFILTVMTAGSGYCLSTYVCADPASLVTNTRVSCSHHLV